MEKQVILVNEDERLPVDIEQCLEETSELLVEMDEYMIPFFKILTNMPQNVEGNPRLSAELRQFFIDEFHYQKYYIGEIFDENRVKRIAGRMESLFAFYDDYSFHDFLQRNSRFSSSRRETPEHLQKLAYNRLRGMLFERVITKIFQAMYEEDGALFASGCSVKIDGEVVKAVHHDITRKTVDIAGLYQEKRSGHLLECKINPIRINELIVKYLDILHKKMMSAGYDKIQTGFVTAGTCESMRLMIEKQLLGLGIKNPGFSVLGLENLKDLAIGA